MDKADLQIGIVAGQHIDEVNLLTTDNLRQPLPVLMGEHIEVGMRQFITENIDPVNGTQDANPHRRGSDDFPVKLLMLFQPLSIAFRRNKDTPFIHARQREQGGAHQHIQQNGIQNQHSNMLQHQIDRYGVDNAERRWRQAFLQNQLTEPWRVAKPGALLHPAWFRPDVAFRPGQRNQRMTIFIEDRHPHRQTSRREKVLHPNGLLDAQQRLQAVGQINRRQGIKIADAGARPLANPEKVIPALFLRGIAVLNNALMQRFQRIITFDRHIAQAEIRHTEIVAANQENTIQIVGRRKIVAPVAHKPGQRLQRPAPGIPHRRTVGVGKQRLKIGHHGFIVARPAGHHAVFRR